MILLFSLFGTNLADYEIVVQRGWRVQVFLSLWEKCTYLNKRRGTALHVYYCIHIIIGTCVPICQFHCKSNWIWIGFSLLVLIYIQNCTKAYKTLIITINLWYILCWFYYCCTPLLEEKVRYYELPTSLPNKFEDISTFVPLIRLPWYICTNSLQARAVQIVPTYIEFHLLVPICVQGAIVPIRQTPRSFSRA